MRKYYYYTYRSKNEIRNGICYFDNGEFDLVKLMEGLYTEHGWCIITFWHEISSTQYEKLNEMF